MEPQRPAQILGSVSEIAAKFNDFASLCKKDQSRNETYSLALNCASGLSCTSEDVFAFINVLALSRTLSSTEEMGMAGIFISAIVNCGSDTSYSIDISKYPDFYLFHVGFRNSKDISLLGNIWHVCEQMQCGSALLYGSGRSSTPQLSIGSRLEGKIEFPKHNDYSHIAHEMQNGRISIEYVTSSIQKQIPMGQIWHGRVLGSADGMGFSWLFPPRDSLNIRKFFFRELSEEEWAEYDQNVQFALKEASEARLRRENNGSKNRIHK